MSVVEAGEKEITRHYTHSMAGTGSLSTSGSESKRYTSSTRTHQRILLIQKGQNGGLTNKNENDWEGSLNLLSTISIHDKDEERGNS